VLLTEGPKQETTAILGRNLGYSGITCNQKTHPNIKSDHALEILGEASLNQHILTSLSLHHYFVRSQSAVYSYRSLLSVELVFLMMSTTHKEFKNRKVFKTSMFVTTASDFFYKLISMLPVNLVINLCFTSDCTANC